MDASPNSSSREHAARGRESCAAGWAAAVWAIVTIGMGGCGGKPLDRPSAEKALLLQAAEMTRAISKGDRETQTQLTYPSLVERLGGAKQYQRRLEDGAQALAARGYRLGAATVGDSAELIDRGGLVYAVVKFRIEMRGPEDAKGMRQSYLIGLSADRGETWSFIDGSGVAGDRTRLSPVLPGFPAELELPGEEVAWETSPPPDKSAN